MTDLWDYKISSWVENGLLKRIEDKFTSWKAKKSLLGLMAGAAVGIYAVTASCGYLGHEAAVNGTTYWMSSPSATARESADAVAQERFREIASGLEARMLAIRAGQRVSLPLELLHFEG